MRTGRVLVWSHGRGDVYAAFAVVLFRHMADGTIVAGLVIMAVDVARGTGECVTCPYVRFRSVGTGSFRWYRHACDVSAAERGVKKQKLCI